MKANIVVLAEAYRHSSAGYRTTEGPRPRWLPREAMGGASSDHSEGPAVFSSALDDLPFGSVGLTREDFLDPEQVVQPGYPPERADILCGAVGLQFENCHSRRATETIDGVTVNFLVRESLKRNKRAAGRHQDLADLENPG